VARHSGQACGLAPGVNLTEVWRSYTPDRPHAQMAFVNTVRSVIDVAGQRVSAHDRLYLASAVPTLIVWGDHDRIIPVAHAYRRRGHPRRTARNPRRRRALLPWRDADRFCVLEDFLKSTKPATAEERWRSS